jgi:hypothetical protein
MALSLLVCAVGVLSVTASRPAFARTDAPPDLSIKDVLVIEGDSGPVNAVFSVTLSLTSTEPITVQYATADGSATAPDDYTAIPTTTLILTPGVKVGTITVVVHGDTLDEPDETFLVNLANPINARLGHAQGQAVILNDELSSVYLPLVLREQPVGFTCPTTSDNQYSGGTAFQYDTDDPVRPAFNHGGKNIELPGYVPNTDPGLQRELVDYGSGDQTQPPQLATMFDPRRVPSFSTFYQVHEWIYASPPDPGHRGDPITRPPVTALGMQTTPGEILHVPTSGYDIGGGLEVTVLFADDDTIALKYAREDSAGSPGYTLLIDNICADPNLLALYDSLDDPAGPRYVYVPPANRPYSYDLPTLAAGQPFGTARDGAIVVAIVDTGAYQDARSCNEWWQIRPGYSGSCPPAQ